MEPPHKKQKICHGCTYNCLSQKDHVGGCLPDTSKYDDNRIIELYAMLDHLTKAKKQMIEMYPNIVLKDCPIRQALMEVNYELMMLGV